MSDEHAVAFTISPPITILRRVNGVWRCAACPLTFEGVDSARDAWGDLIDDGGVRAAQRHFFEAHGTEADAAFVRGGRRDG